MKQFDFDEWANLHEQDPEAFEVKRGATLERLIRSVDEESRLALEQTLFKVEMVRRRAKSPLQATIEASNLMWESFGKLREKVQELEASACPNTEAGRTNQLRLVTAEDMQDDSLDRHSSTELQTDGYNRRGTAPRPDMAEAKIIRFPRKNC